MATLRGVRVWGRAVITLTAAYAIALQVLLAGLAAAHFGVIDGSSSDLVFVTCLGHSINSDSDQGGSKPQPVDRAPCPLCTLAAATCAVLPTNQLFSIIAREEHSSITPQVRDQVVRYNSPTTHYQRGPPVSTTAAG